MRKPGAEASLRLKMSAPAPVTNPHRPEPARRNHHSQSAQLRGRRRPACRSARGAPLAGARRRPTGSWVARGAAEGQSGRHRRGSPYFRDSEKHTLIWHRVPFVVAAWNLATTAKCGWWCEERC